MGDLTDELTAFEVSIAERTCGIPIGALADPAAPKLGLYGALAWVHVKRSEPTLKFDDYMKRVKADEILNYLYPDDEEPAAEGETAEAAGFPEGPDGDADSGDAGDGEGPVLPGYGDLAV